MSANSAENGPGLQELAELSDAQELVSPLSAGTGLQQQNLKSTLQLMRYNSIAPGSTTEQLQLLATNLQRFAPQEVKDAALLADCHFERQALGHPATFLGAFSGCSRTTFALGLLLTSTVGLGLVLFLDTISRSTLGSTDMSREAIAWETLELSSANSAKTTYSAPAIAAITEKLKSFGLVSCVVEVTEAAFWLMGVGTFITQSTINCNIIEIPGFTEIQRQLCATTILGALSSMMFATSELALASATCSVTSNASFDKKKAICASVTSSFQGFLELAGQAGIGAQLVCPMPPMPPNLSLLASPTSFDPSYDDMVQSIMNASHISQAMKTALVARLNASGAASHVSMRDHMQQLMKAKNMPSFDQLAQAAAQKGGGSIPAVNMTPAMMRTVMSSQYSIGRRLHNVSSLPAAPVVAETERDLQGSPGFQISEKQANLNIATCVQQAGLVTAQSSTFVMAIAFIAIQSTFYCVPDPLLPQAPIQCAIDILGVIGILGLTVSFMSGTIDRCGLINGVGNPNANCVSAISGVIGAATEAIASGLALEAACDADAALYPAAFTVLSR